MHSFSDVALSGCFRMIKAIRYSCLVHNLVAQGSLLLIVRRCKMVHYIGIGSRTAIERE